MHNIYTYKDDEGAARSIRLLRNDILVKVDPAPTKSAGGLHLPGGAVEHILNTGTIVAYGFLKLGGRTINGKHYPSIEVPVPDIKIGDKCCFIRFLAEQHTNKQMQERFEKDLIKIGPTDILFCFEPTDNPRIG